MYIHIVYTYVVCEIKLAWNLCIYIFKIQSFKNRRIERFKYCRTKLIQ